jgi:hypothetical protein
MSEAKDSQAAIGTELVEHKQGVKNSLIVFRNELVEIRKGIKVKVQFTLLQATKAQKESRGIALLFL